MRPLHRVRHYLLLAALLSELSSCTVANPKHPLGLRPAAVIPIAPAGSGAPTNAQPVTVAKPRDIRSDKEVARSYTFLLLILAVKHSAVIEQDPGAWIGNGLTAGLENAGYHVERADDIKDAKTPLVIGVDVTDLKIEVPWVSGFKCKVAAQIEIFKQGKAVFERVYEGEAERGGMAASDADMTSLMQKALENWLAKSVPEVAAALAPLTQPSPAVGTSGG